MRTGIDQRLAALEKKAAAAEDDNVIDVHWTDATGAVVRISRMEGGPPTPHRSIRVEYVDYRKGVEPDA